MMFNQLSGLTQRGGPVESTAGLKVEKNLEDGPEIWKSPGAGIPLKYPMLVHFFGNITHTDERIFK